MLKLRRDVMWVVAVLLVTPGVRRRRLLLSDSTLGHAGGGPRCKCAERVRRHRR